MANKFALGLIAAGLVSAVGVNLYQAADRGRYVATTQAETVEYAPAPEPETPTLTAEQKAECVAEQVEADMCYKYLVALAEIEYDQMQQWRRGR